ncbi:MAG: hypothetical protein IPG99_20750 [Ignavibacteria bacterium]|nr:hypothetical protein [Ignavibacteria bacterium]
MSATDRITGLRENLTVTGIDFIFISASQVNLDIYFYEFNIPAPPASPVLIKTLLSDLSATDIRIYNEEGTIPDIEVLSVSWSADNVLSAVLKNPGDFTLYKIIINDRKLAGILTGLIRTITMFLSALKPIVQVTLIVKNPNMNARRKN